MGFSQDSVMCKQPILVSLVFDSLSGERLCSLLRESNVWMVESVENKLALEVAAKLTDLTELPGEISCGPLDPEQGPTAWFSEVLSEIDMHHDGVLWTEWEKVNVHGLSLSEEVRSIAEGYGSVQISESGCGFAIINSDKDV